MPIIIPANSAVSGGFNVANSLRFNSGSSDKLNRSTGVTTTNTKFTLSFWLKLCDISNFQSIFQTYKASNERFECGFNLDNSNQPRFVVQEYTGSYIFRKIFTRLSRDVAAWTNYVIKFDSSEAEANRLRVYINGIEETATDTVNLPSSGASSIISVGTQNIGYSQSEDGQYFNGYLAEFVLVEATDYAPTDFGEFDDSGIWKPIDVSGLTFGTNGYYLQYKEAGTSQNSSGIGADTSGNNNHFACDDVVAIDQTTDTCTNNFATINPLANFYQQSTFAEGNTQVTFATSPYSYNIGTFGVASGKWYWEIKYVSAGGDPNNSAHYGISGKGDTIAADKFLGYNSTDYGITPDDGGRLYNNNSHTSNSLYNFAIGDILSFALDLDSGTNTLKFYRNGTEKITTNISSSPESGFYFPAFGFAYSNAGSVAQLNFGNPPFAISSGNQDADGYGNFEYAVPSGYFSLNTKNLAEYG